MKDQRKNVALIFGGTGAEHDVSLSGAPYLYGLIDKSKYNVLPLLIEKSGCMTSASIIGGSVIPSGTAAHLFRMFGRGGVVTDGDFTPIAAAIPLLHGDHGEDGCVQGALEHVGIPYIGCDGRAGSLCLDKIYAKLVAEHLGIPTAKFHALVFDDKLKELEDYLSSPERGVGKPHALPAICEIEASLGYPVFVKPSLLGSSIGISIANGREELISSIREAAARSPRVLIEERIELISEAECAVFLSERKRIFTDPGEVSIGGEFYDYRKKYSGKASVSERSSLSDSAKEKVKKYSEMLSDHIGIRHLSRIDFLISHGEGIFFNEINTFPGFTKTSLYPRLLSAAGLDPSEALSLWLSEVAGE